MFSRTGIFQSWKQIPVFFHATWYDSKKLETWNFPILPGFTDFDRIWQMAVKAVIVPAQEAYTVSHLVDATGYTRQAIAKAIRDYCPTAGKSSKGYSLSQDEACLVLAGLGYSATFATPGEAETASEAKTAQPVADRMLAGLVATLQAQLEAKDRQIADLQAQVSMLVEQNGKLTEAIAKQDDTITALVDTAKAQALSSAVQTVTGKQEIVVAEPRKLSLWQRIFRH